MQTAQEIQTQIDQIDREVKDIHASLKRLTRVQDLLDAHGELTNRANVVSLLQERLEDAKTREAAAAEKARRQANTDAMEAARAAYEDVIDRFNARKLALIRHMTAESDELDPLSFELQRLQREFQAAWVANNPDKRHDSVTWPRLSGAALDLTGPEKHADDALRVLYASRIGYGGTYKELSDALMNQGAQQFAAGFYNAPRPQELTQPNTAVDEAMGYAISRMENRDD